MKSEYKFFNSTIMSPALALMLAACLSPDAPDGASGGDSLHLESISVYTEDFETTPGPEWSLQTLDVAHQSTGTRFSGRFANHTQRLTLALPPGDYRLSFDFYQFDTWDGGAPGCSSSYTGPDRFLVTANGAVVFNEIFSRWGRSVCQSYQPLAPLQHLGGRTTVSDARYRLTVPITNLDTTLSIGFRGAGLQSVNDESWGIDNIEIVQLVAEPNCHSGVPGDRSYCSEACPCDEGEGDCDGDTEQCAPGLTCVHNVGANYGWEPDIDVCEATCHPSAPGSGNYCSADCPCEEGEGDCDGDTEECAPGLTCVHNVGANYGWDPDVDVCEATCHPSAPGSGNYCSADCPCEEGEGDCDGDTEECAPGLTCVHNVGANYGWDPDVDVCENPNASVVLPSCKAIRDAGLASGDGVYFIDPDGAGGMDGFDVQCDMTTDGGGWTRVMYVLYELNSTGSVNLPHLIPGTADAKLDDAVIRLLALSGDREILMDNGATSYIERYSAAEWNTWAANGATNMSYDVKDSSNTWHLDLCNGHWNNRGFSTWDDSPYQPCAVPYSGSPRYMTSYHVNSYPNGIGVPFQVSVR